MITGETGNHQPKHWIPGTASNLRRNPRGKSQFYVDKVIIYDDQASRQRNSFKEIKRSKSEGSMMKKSPTLVRIRGSRKSRGHSRQGSAGGF